MTTITIIVFGFSLFFLVISIYSVAKTLRDWEAKQITKVYKLPSSVAHKVANKQLTLEEIDQAAWDIICKEGVDFDTAKGIRDGVLHEPTQPKQMENHEFPFKMKPIRKGNGYFELAEIGSEPNAYINASTASVWTYYDNKNISHFVLSGHANGPVCRQLTSLIINTYLFADSFKDNMIVPGACIIRGAGALPEIKFKVSNNALSPNINFENLFQKQIHPVQRITGDLVPFVKDTGLLRIFPPNEGLSYIELTDRLKTVIKSHYSPGKEILVSRQSIAENPNALFVPYFELHNNNLSPLHIDLPLSLFSSKEFNYLKDVHQRSLVLELTDDATRRKRIYEEWLQDDKLNQQKFSSYYHSLSDAEKKAERLSIGGVRDYVSVTVKKPGDSETYMSPEKYFTEVLPSLLEQDKSWIAQMDRLIKEINNRDEGRDKKLEEINIATLIDSFLRGWPSVFLGSEEGEVSYENWCSEKREIAWRVIHKYLMNKSIRIDPIIEENTVFQVQIIDEGMIRITPLHLINESDCLIYLSSKFGIPFYIDSWSRKKISTSTIRNPINKEIAVQYYKKAVDNLDTVTDVDGQLMIEGITNLKKALIYHPLITAQQFWNDWWARYSRDTTGEFEIFKGLMRGIQAYKEGSYSIAMNKFQGFIELYPDMLADPYIFLAFHQEQVKEKILPLLNKKQKKIASLNRLINDHNNKLRMLESNKELELVYGEYTILDTQQNKQLMDIKHVRDEVNILRGRIEHLQVEVNNDDKFILKKTKSVWSSLKQKPNEYIQKAIELDKAHVEKVIEKNVMELSPRYWLRYRPLHELLSADELIDIAEKLAKASNGLAQNLLSIEELKKLISDMMEVEYLQKTEISALEEFFKKIDSLIDADSILRELILRKEIDQMAQNYFQKGLFQYEQSAYLLPEFVEPIKRLVSLYARYRLQYKKSLSYMTAARISLRNFSPSASVQLLSDVRKKIVRIEFDDSNNELLGEAEDGDKLKLIRIGKLKNDEKKHLQRELGKPEILQRLGLGISAADVVANLQIATSPVSQRWSAAIKGLEKELIAVIAYAGILPIPGDEIRNSQVLKPFDKRTVVEKVNYENEVALSKFYDEFGINDNRVIKVSY
jgi:hypothetical protein